MKLHEAFRMKSEKLLHQSVFWIIAVALSIWFLTRVANGLFQDFMTIETASTSLVPISIDDGMFVRLALLFPAIYAVYFAASEFRKTMKLKEVYDFKATIIASLIPFRELVATTNSKDGTQKFIINAVTDIIKSPMQEVYGIKDGGEIEKRAKDMVEGIVDTVGSVLPK
jgi:hypothetical protein